MTSVVLKPNESQDQLMRRFRKKVIRSGVLSDVRKRRWYISRNEERRNEAKKSTRRMKMRNRYN